MEELQPRQTFFMPGVQPGQDAKDMRLSGGIREPFYYSLSSRSTVPYVTISGGTKSNKLLSWGEIIMVPPGEMLSVKNSSYHQGDIAINSGRDYVEIPTRVTVPVPLGVVAGPGPGEVTRFATYPVDCRRAKRAYATIATLISSPGLVNILGVWRESSFNTSYDIALDTGPSLPQYIEQVTIPAFTKFGLFPLGKRAPDTITPMTLGDTAQFSFSYILADLIADPTNKIDEAFYTLEY